MAEKVPAVVLLLSDQTIPNITFLKWVFSNSENGKTPLIIFISTEKMEKNSVSVNTIKAMKLNNTVDRYEVFIVKEDNINLITDELNNIYNKYLPETLEWYVNFTGGTKPMSISLYSFFNNKKNTNLYYQPIGKGIQQVYPEEKSISVSNIISLEEYFTSFGVSYSAGKCCLRDWGYNKRLFEEFKNNVHLDFTKQMHEIQEFKYFKKKMNRKKFLDFKNLDKEKIAELEQESKVNINIDYLIENINNFGFDPCHLIYSEQKYITGGWFEEYVYQKIKNEMNIDESRIAINIELKKGGSSNELDVVYLSPSNQLNVIECKSFINENSQPELLNNTLYKAQAIKKELGLYVKSYLYTISLIEKEANRDRAKMFDIEIVDGSKLSQ